jgi:HlyD family secretion protein
MAMLLLAGMLCASCGQRSGKPDGSGTIECTQVRVAAEVGGRIAALHFREGDYVKKGQKLGEIDPAGYQLRRDEASAALAQAQAQLDLMLAGNRDEDIQRARAQVREAKAVADADAADRQRIIDVFTKESCTPRQRDEAVAKAERSAAALSAAEQQLARLVRGNRQEEIRSSQAAADLAKARLAQSEKAVHDCVIMAPMDGAITTKTCEPGEVLGPGVPWATLSRLDEVWVSLYIPEPALGRVKLGQKVSIAIDGDATRYDGDITYISPEAEFTPRNVQTPDERAKLVYRVKVTLPNPRGIFKPGMPADGFLSR